MNDRKVMIWAAKMLGRIRDRIRKNEWRDKDYCVGALKSVEMALRRGTNPLLRDDMNDSKGFSKSLTNWAAVLVMAAAIFGFSVSEPDAEMYVEKVTVIAGAVLAIVGRFRATKRIKGL